ncbi:MAG: sensor histidine kinase [Enterocloster sp.]
MLPKFKKLSLEKQLFLSFFSVSACLLVLSLGISLFYNVNRRKAEIDSLISGVAAYAASMDQVIHMLDSGYPDRETAAALDGLHENFPDLNVIAIYDRNLLRFYHTTRRESGESLINGEEQAVLSGSGPYITTGIGTHGTQRRAFHAVVGNDGAISGFVMASAFSTYIAGQSRQILSVYATVLAVMLVISLLLSHGTVRLLRSSLMGYHPRNSEAYLRQDTVLNAMEGISPLISDTMVTNQPTRPCSLQGGAAGPAIARLFQPQARRSCGWKSVGQGCSRASHLVVPIGNLPKIQGVLTILNDRYEVETLSDELSGARSMLDTLRAFNHEFLNKLHVILGYLQTGQTQQAITFITNSSLVSSQAIRQTADCLRVHQICALVVGKLMHAAELGILLTVSPDSRCMGKDLVMDVGDCVTLVGNLLENAIEELHGSKKEIREITLGIYASTEGTVITCEDTGRGIPAPVLERVFDNGFSTKGEGRGTGLHLVRQIVDRCGGEISIDTEEGEGTCFTLTFTRKEYQ